MYIWEHNAPAIAAAATGTELRAHGRQRGENPEAHDFDKVAKHAHDGERCSECRTK